MTPSEERSLVTGSKLSGSRRSSSTLLSREPLRTVLLAGSIGQAKVCSWRRAVRHPASMAGGSVTDRNQKIAFSRSFACGIGLREGQIAREGRAETDLERHPPPDPPRTLLQFAIPFREAGFSNCESPASGIFVKPPTGPRSAGAGSACRWLRR